MPLTTKCFHVFVRAITFLNPSKAEYIDKGCSPMNEQIFKI